MLEEFDFLCVWGRGDAIGDEIKAWLGQDEKRRLVFVSDQTLDPSFKNQRIKQYLFESPLQIDLLAKQIAWEAVFLKLGVIAEGEGSSYFEEFKKLLVFYHEGADLLLSDAADCGLSSFERVCFRTRRSIRSALGLKGAFSGIPAVIVGAGPSLEKNKALLKGISSRALILAGGAALNFLDFAPHFGGAIDGQAPYSQFKQMKFWETPFCFQSRMNPENFFLIHGEALLVPESHFSFLNWLDGEEGVIEGGWTVGNLMASLASFWGCNPIVFVGMDFCYHENQKYAGDLKDSSENICFVDGFWTQRDWVMAQRWMGELAKNNVHQKFINATEGGMGFSSPIEEMRLDQIDWGREKGLDSRVYQAIQSLPLLSFCEERWELWEKSLERCSFNCQKGFIEEEIVYEKFLAPLWNLWRPIFERELDCDPHLLSREEKLTLHQFLFFQQAIQGQLDVLSKRRYLCETL